jgi:hypothetical protein
MYDLLCLARMANDVYEPGNSARLLGHWTRQDKPREYGNFYACAYKYKGAGDIVTVAIRGTDDTEDAWVDDVGGIGLGLGALVMDYTAACDYVSMWKRHSRKLFLTGHSLGGAYVQLVGSKLGVPGVSFNAPGVMNLINMMSGSWATRIASGALHALTLGKIAYVTGTDAPNDSGISNFRGDWDPVSKIGVHVGLPLKTVRVGSTSPHPHSMLPLIRALEH